MRKGIPHHTIAILSVSLAIGAAACGEEPEQQEEQPEQQEEPPPPYIEPGGCGLPSYEWLPAAQVGHPLSAKQDVLSPMPPAGLDTLLEKLTDELSPVPYGARVHHIRYTTQDRGELVEATGLVSVPWLPDGVAGTFPVVLWLHGTTGFNGECAPSRLGGEHALGNYLLSALGFIVVAPDYIGLDANAEIGVPPPVHHAYLNIEQTALGSWDMVRAAQSFLAEDVDTDALMSDEVILWGGSQGGHAAFSCDLMQPYYAPEYPVLASVALIPPMDLMGQADRAFSRVVATTRAMAAFLVGQHQWFGKKASLYEVFLPQVADLLYDAMFIGCRPDDVFRGMREVEEAFQPDLISAALDDHFHELDPWGCYVQANSITETSVPRLNETPTLVVLGERDTLVYTPVERDAFDRLCEMGYQLEYLECADAKHTQGAAWSLLDQIAWVEDRLAGKPIDEAARCVRTPPVRCSSQPD